MKIIGLAEICFYAHVAYCLELGESVPEQVWDNTSDLEKSEWCRKVRFRLANEMAPVSVHHAEWRESMEKDGWRVGEFDEEAKLHPQLCSYDQLPVEERRKDDLFVSIVQTFATAVEDGPDPAATLYDPQPAEAGLACATDVREPRIPWLDPTPDMLSTPEFEAVWRTIKGWDINVPGAYGGYCGATGNHVRAILDGLKAHLPNWPLLRGVSAAEKKERAAVEKLAEKLYDDFRKDHPEGKDRTWVPGGNSEMQDKARQWAREWLAKEKIFLEHEAQSSHNAGMPGMPQGPCICAVCKEVRPAYSLLGEAKTKSVLASVPPADSKPCHHSTVIVSTGEGSGDIGHCEACGIGMTYAPNPSRWIPANGPEKQFTGVL